MLWIFLSCAARQGAQAPRLEASVERPLTSPAVEGTGVHAPLELQVGELVGEGQSLSITFAFPQDAAWRVQERVSSQRFGAGEQEMTLEGRYTLRAQSWDGGVWLRASDPVLAGSPDVLAEALLAKPPDWSLSPDGQFLGVDADQDYLAELQALFPAQDLRLSQLDPAAVASSGGGYMQRNLWDKGVGVLLGQDFVVGTERSFQVQTVLATGESLPTTLRVVVLGERDCGGRPCVAVSMAEQTDPEATAALLQRNLRLSYAAANQGGVMPSVSYAGVQTQRSILLFPETGVPYSEAVLTDTRVRVHTQDGAQDTHSLEVRERSWRPQSG